MIDLNFIVRPLLDFYQKEKRDLPWRRTRDPYKIWLSEIMCQQTRVDTVINYYNRVVSALPTVEELAACPEQKLLKLWEGLGYYSRARNLVKAARQIVELGFFPDTAEEIAALAGVGDYTAGAIASIAFERPSPAVDGNVLRVLSRVTGDDRVIDLPQTKRAYADALKVVYPVGSCGDFTQALMELGALVCIPNGAPHCDRCPLKEVCIAARENLIDKLPVRAEKKGRRVEERTVAIMCSDSRIGIVRRGNSGLLSGLWSFPDCEGARSDREIISELSALGITAKVVKTTRAKHIFTHVEWWMRIVLLACDKLPDGVKAVTAEELDGEYPLPTAYKAARKLLTEYEDKEQS